jgi:hypothetical protein
MKKIVFFQNLLKIPLVFRIALACTNIADCCFLVTIVQLVGRLSQEELIVQLPTFLPALFDAFNNQSPDVRKVSTIIFSLLCIIL